MAYTFRTIQVNPGSADPVTYSALNLGSGSFFLVMALYVQNSTTLSGITVNGSSLAVVTGASTEVQFWSGNVTVTGSDTVVVSGTSSLAFLDVNIAVWTSSAVTATSSLSNVASSIATASSVGDYVFAASEPATNFTGSAQAPAGQHTVTGGNGGILTVADWVAASGGISGGNFTATANAFSNNSIVDFTPSGGAAVVRGFDYIQDDIYPKRNGLVATSMPPAYGRTPFVAPNTNAGIPWSGPRDHVRLPIRTSNISEKPAFVSTFKTAPISGMAWREPVDDIRIPPRVSYSAQPAFTRTPPPVINSNAGIPWFKLPDLPGISERILDSGPAEPTYFVTPVPISGMAWFEPRDKDYPARVNFLTDPVPNVFIPVTVTWSFAIGDTTFLRDAPVDVPPGLGRAPFVAPVGISGIGWFEPPDRDRPATKVTIETPPAAFGRAIAQAAPISGMAWFTPLDWSKAKVSFDGPSAFALRPPVGTPISGISWFEPPDRDRPANKVRIEAPPSIALTPATLPVPIRGMAWFEPPDRDRPATKFKLDNPPAWIYFLQSVITGTLVATESPDTVTITMTYRDLWVAATKETELWTPAIKQAETWTPE